MPDLFEVHVRLHNAMESNVIFVVSDSIEKATTWIKATNPGIITLTVRKRAVIILD